MAVYQLIHPNLTHRLRSIGIYTNSFFWGGVIVAVGVYIRYLGNG